MTPLRQRLYLSAPFASPAPTPSPEEVELLRTELLEMIEANGTATFPDLAAHARELGFEVDGDSDITNGSPSRNVILYRGVHRLLFAAINTLVLQKEVYLQPCHHADAVDDRVADLPIAKRLPARGFCQPTWLPVCILPVPF
jgi:hypothetical protein